MYCVFLESTNGSGFQKHMRIHTNTHAVRGVVKKRSEIVLEDKLNRDN